MSDWMGNFTWGYSKWRTPSRLLRQQKKAIKQAGQKLQAIDKQYSTKILKDDIQAENLLTDLEAHHGAKTIAGYTVWWIITTEDHYAILVQDTNTWRWFPKGQMFEGETPEQTLQRSLLKETGLSIGSDIKILWKIGEYEGYSSYHKTYRVYIRYHLHCMSDPIKISSKKPHSMQLQKFDIENILAILESDHQQSFRKSIVSHLYKTNSSTL